MLQGEGIVGGVVFELEHVFCSRRRGDVAGSGEGGRYREVVFTTARGVGEVNLTAVKGLVESLDRLVVAIGVACGSYSCFGSGGGCGVGCCQSIDLLVGLILGRNLRAGRGREEREDKCGEILFFHTP